MKLSSLVQRLGRGDLHYVLGRFETVRAGYSRVRSVSSPKDRAPWTAAEKSRSLFAGLEVGTVLQQLRATAMADGLTLPGELVESIRDYAATATLKTDKPNETLHRNDLTRGRLSDGRRVPIAYVAEPLGCAAVRRVVEDPFLVHVAASYLGFFPTGREIRLYYSLAGDLTDEDRRAHNQTIDFHFDVHALNFCYFHFYLTDADASSGAHVIVLGSHREKRLSHLFGSARRTDREILDTYGKDRIRTIEGPAGSGFVEDTSCYHKALAPVAADRLLLQFRFF